MVSVGGSKSSSPLSAIIPWNTGTLGYTACVGIVLLLIASRRSDRRLLDSEEQDGNESEESGGESSSLSLYQFVFDSLSRLRELFISSRSGEDYDREEDLDGETFVVHQGSCHCGAIAFEVSLGGPLGDYLPPPSRGAQTEKNIRYCINRYRLPLSCK